MKPSYHIVLILLFFGTSLKAQNGIGISYSTRIFPFQQYNNTNSDYLYEEYAAKDDITVSNAFENQIAFYYEYKSQKGKQRIQQIGLSNYYSRLIFERDAASYGGNGDVGGSSGWSWEQSRSGIYDYNFLGLMYASLKDRTLTQHFSLRLGTELTFNFLVYHCLHHRVNEITETQSYTVYTGPNAGTYSTVNKTTDENVPDPNQEKFNFKIAFPCYLRYAFNKHTIGVGIAPGISTQSRLLVNSMGFNLFVSPTISYTYFPGN